MSRRNSTTRLRLRPDHLLLVTAALAADGPALEAWEQWSRQIDLDAIDDASVEMIPLLTENLTRLDVTDPLLDRLVGVTRQSWYRNQLLIDAAGAAARRLHDAGIDCMLVRGAAIAAAAYPDVGLRHIGRSGLAVYDATPTRAGAHLVTAGWLTVTPGDGSVLATDRRGLQVLLTSHVLTDHPNDAADAPFWEGRHQQAVAGTRISIPALTDTLLMSMLEGLRHGRPTELRWIGDAVTAVRRGGERIEWDRVVAVARRLQRGLRVGAGFDYLRRTLELPVPPEVVEALIAELHSRRERTEHRLWARGTPGSRPSALVRHWYRYRRTQHETGSLLHFGRYARRALRARSRR